MKATKTEMLKLLRLIDFGAGEDVCQLATETWHALTIQQREACCAADKADGRRARLWRAAWYGATFTLTQTITDWRDHE